MSDLDDLERLAKAAQKVWFSNVPLPELRAYHDASRPEAVLALVARVREAEAVIAEVGRLADETDVETHEATQAWLVGNLRAAIDRYKNGATQ